MATLTQLRVAVQQKLGLDSTAAGVEETLLTGWLNEAVVDVLLRSRCNVNLATITTTANVGDYTLPTSILAVQDLTYSDTTGVRQLRRITPEEILRRRFVAYPGAIVSAYALNGSDMLMLSPSPTSVNTISLYYVPRPLPMSSASHDPSDDAYGGIPLEYQKAVELYAMAEAAEFTDHQPSGFGGNYRQLYEQKLIEIKRGMRHKGGRSLGPVILGRRSPATGSNSMYPVA